MKVPTGGKGGMIILSTDINATADQGLGGWLAARWRTVWQRMCRHRLVDQVVLRLLKRSGVGLGWSIGPSFQGRYYNPETRILHSERSFIIEFLDAPYPLLKAIADELVRAFHQEVVLLKSHDTGEVEWLPDG